MKAIFLLVVVLAIPSAFAEVSIVNQRVAAGESWTVPEEKNFILIQAVRIGATQDQAFDIYVPDAGESEPAVFVAVGQLRGGAIALPFVGGTRFQNRPGNSSILLIGRLVDDSDLFACIPARFTEVEDRGAELAATLKADSARPSRVTVESSDDGVSWSADGEAVVAREGSGEFEVSLSKGDQGRKLIRAKVSSKPEAGS